MFSIQIDRFSFPFKVILTRNPIFLTDNQYGPRKSRVLIWNINTPLILWLGCVDTLWRFILLNDILYNSTQTIVNRLYIFSDSQQTCSLIFALWLMISRRWWCNTELTCYEHTIPDYTAAAEKLRSWWYQYYIRQLWLSCTNNSTWYRYKLQAWENNQTTNQTTLQ